MLQIEYIGDYLMEKNKKDRKKVLVTIISNRGYWPMHFSISLVKLMEYTRKHHNAELMTVKSCDINYMRNRACLIAQNKGKEANGTKYDYFVQLDDDHIYPEDFIVKFIGHNKDIVVGCTSQRTPPWNQTQFKEFTGVDNFKSVNNIVNPKPEDGLIEVGFSGPVGMTMKTEVLEKLKFPYFKIEYLNTNPSIVGGDISFCRQLKEKGIKMYLDSSVSFPHCVGEAIYADRGETKMFW